MLPFSVLRIWGLGLISWLVLGLGAYCAYETYRAFRTEPVARLEQVEPADRDVAAAENEPHRAVAQTRPHSDSRRWALLAATIACFSVSLGGFWPVSFLLGNARGEKRQRLQPSQSLMVDRPDQSRLHVEVYGKSDAPSLLLVHGWSLNTSAWDYVKETLAAQHRVIAFDLRGMGRSRGPSDGDYSLERMAADVASVVEATANGRPIILVGHSIGGMTVQTFARTQTRQLRDVLGLVLLHTTYTNPVRTNLFHPLTTAIESLVIVPLWWLTIVLWPLAWLSNFLGYLNGSLHISTRFTSFSGKQTREQLDHGAWLAACHNPAAVGRGNLAMLKFNEEATLRDVELPVLTIAGKNDRMTLPSASEHIANLLPQDRLLHFDTGHLGHWELGSTIASAILEFADQVLPAEDAKRPARPVAERLP